MPTPTPDDPNGVPASDAGAGEGALLGGLRLVGEVAARVFADDASGFGVVELAAGSGPIPPSVADALRDTSRGGPRAVRASGPLASLAPGQTVALVGRWTISERHGPTFRADYFEQARPRTTQGLVTFLSSGRFRGVGPIIARRLVEAFGTELASVIEQQPERLAEVQGVSRRLAASVVAAWRETGALAAVVQQLAVAGVPAAVAQRVHQTHGDAGTQLIAEDPYQLLAVRGFTWQHAEKLAAAAGIGQRDPRRLAAGAAHAQGECCRQGGHQAVDVDELQAAAARLLRVPGAELGRALQLAVEAELLVLDEGLWYAPGDLWAERSLAEDIARLVAGRSRVSAGTRSAADDPALTDEQAAAVRSALDRPVSVLTGGPGTGKTHTLLALVRACEAADLRVALCAPTGRGAKRLEEVTGRPASTVHRLLEARGEAGEGFTFGYDHRRRLPHDVVVVDEASMADTALAAALARAVDDGSHLVLVGDADQLPSVGRGAVLRDLLDPRLDGTVGASRLTRVHRQAASSRIVTLAHDVRRGQVPPLRGAMGDVFAVPEEPGRIAGRVAEIVAERAPAHFGCAPADVQVLAPVYRGVAGVDELNAALKQRLNPPQGRRAVAGWHEGDRVVQTRNDAELDLANGDIGEVMATDPATGTLQVAFPQGTVTIPARAAGDLAPAWCLTVHKSQGGEWPVVVLVLAAGHRSMLWRELVYTAVSRAQRGLLLVGEPNLLRAAARRAGSGALHRRTRLVERVLQNRDGVHPPADGPARHRRHGRAGAASVPARGTEPPDQEQRT